ncbi:MAG: hypothetical protein ACSHWQ_05765 [Spongiibacteraceae bacterium]
MLKAIVGLLALWLSIAELSAETLYYRYPGSDGVLVIDKSVPPGAISRGYDVLNSDGRVVRTVEPELTGAAKKARDQELAVAHARNEAAEKMRAWDESLLLRYSDVSDIDVAKLRALNNINVRISILRSNLALLTKQLLKNQDEAAELERSGKEVPKILVDTQLELRAELSAMESQIEARNAELGNITEAYERDKARFIQLQDSVARRRQYTAP